MNVLQLKEVLKNYSDDILVNFAYFSEGKVTHHAIGETLEIKNQLFLFSDNIAEVRKQ